MKISQVNVTPRIAESWLGANKINRKVSETTVGRYASMMKAGGWQENGEAIKFNGDGSLMDGQHRLLAIVRSKVPQKLVVVRGLDKNVFPSFDTHKKRNLGDVMSIAGIKKYNSHVATLTRLVYDYERHGLADMFSGTATKATAVSSSFVSNAEFLKYYKENEGIGKSLNAVLELMPNKTSKRFIAPLSMQSFWFYLFRQKDEEKAKIFIKKFSSGINLDGDDPIHRFREKIIGYRMAKTTPNRKILTILAVKSWNYWKGGDRPKALHAHKTSAMPKVL